MIGFVIQEGRGQQLFASGLSAAAGRLDCDEDLIDLSEHVGIFELQSPAIL